MPATSPLDQIAERVERLLTRHQEVQRTNALLQQEVEALTRERDGLKSRLSAARARIDALIDRLPTEPTAPLAPAATTALATSALASTSSLAAASSGQE